MANSDLQDDSRVAKKDRRRLKLQDVEVSLRDQIPEKLASKLTEMKIGLKVANMWARGNSHRQEWLDRQRIYLKDWDEFLESSAEGPFQGTSSLHVPMPLIVAKSMHARFFQALIGIDPPFSLRARREDSIERAEAVGAFIQYYLKEWVNYRDGIDEVLDKWLWKWITQGSGILKGRWDAEYESFVDVEMEQVPGPSRFEFDENNQEIEIPTVVEQEKEVRKTKKKWEGVVFEAKDTEDVLILGGGGDPQRADAVLDRYFVTASELWTFVDRKVFKESVVKEIIKGGPDSISGALSTHIKDERARNAGSTVVDDINELSRYEIIEAYMNLDVDGSGINSEVVVWVHQRTRKILRATYLNRINKTGERPYFKIDYHKRHNAEYGIGVIEMLHPLSIEMDAIHNLRIDYGMLSAMPFGFYRPTSNVEKEVIKLEPGTLIPVDNPQTDVFFPNMGNRTSFGFQEEGAIQTMIERLTGINDLSLGVITGAQGATRTATGARALLGELNANLDIFLRRMNRGWKKALEYLLHTLQQKIEPGFPFLVTGQRGEDYWLYVQTQADLEGDFDFELMANSANSNAVIERETAQQIFQLTQNPILLQLGIITPDNMFEAAKKLLKSLNVPNWNKFITGPIQSQHMLTPEQEANRVLRGIPVPVIPAMDHEGFINYWNEIQGSDELLGQFNEVQTAQMAAQAASHERMLAALEQAAAQERNRQQVQTNAALSSQVSQNPAPQSSPQEG